MARLHAPMNARCYRLARNARTGLAVPVGENARTRRGRASAGGALRSALAATGAVLSAAALSAGPLPVPCAGGCGPGSAGFVGHGAATFSTDGAS